MADINSTEQRNTERAVNFAGIGRLYQLVPDAEKSDVHDQLYARLVHLSAMLKTLCVGNGFENFDGLLPETKSDYLWACSMLADECKSLHDYV